MNRENAMRCRYTAADVPSTANYVQLKGFITNRVMNISSIQGRLGLLLAGFALLVASAVGVTYWGIEAQSNDARLINLAGRQRMLIQQMTRLSLQIKISDDPQAKSELLDAGQTFEQTLDAMQFGGHAPYLPGQLANVPAARDATILQQLQQLRNTWAVFRNAAGTVASEPPGSSSFNSAVQQMEQMSANLVQQADQVVRQYEGVARQNTNRLRLIQAAFFASAIALLLLGSWSTRNSILRPLRALGQSAARIGSGDLDTAVQVQGLEEVKVLAATLESTRAQLKSTQQELMAWANRLEQRVDQRTRELNALYDVNREISSRLDTQHVLRSVTEKACQLLGAEVATLCLLDESHKQLQLTAFSGPQNAITGKSSTDLAGITGSVLSSALAVSCGTNNCQASCGIMNQTFHQSHLAAPLRAGEHVIGALCVGSQDDEIFPEEANNILTKLANAAAVALENARLYDQAERVAALEERQRIAAEIHDGLGQTLSSLGLMVDQTKVYLESGQVNQAQEQLERTRQIINQAVQEARGAIDSLLQVEADKHSLQEQLKEILEEFSQPEYPQLEWVDMTQAPIYLSREDCEQVLYITQEAITNAIRHAGAQQILVQLQCARDQASLHIHDDGKGFDPEASPKDGQKHFGMKVMRARAAHLQGEVEITSMPGDGAQITLRWPIHPSTETRNEVNATDSRPAG
jgi:two-component system nitrate/nitrite sensor histidine kinase NarX